MSEKTYTDEKGAIFTEDRKTLLEVPRDLEEYVVPEGTESIASFAFPMATLLKAAPLCKVVLPASLKRVDGSGYKTSAKRVVMKGKPAVSLWRDVSKTFNEEIMNINGIDLHTVHKKPLSKEEKLFISKAKAGKRQALFDAISIVVDGFIDNRDIDPMKALVYYSAGDYLYDEFMRSDHPLTKKLDKYPAYLCDVMGNFNRRYIKREEDYDFTPEYDSRYKDVCMQEIATNPNQKQVEALCYGICLLLDD